jgi:hypothetical protein
VGGEKSVKLMASVRSIFPRTQMKYLTSPAPTQQIYVGKHDCKLKLCERHAEKLTRPPAKGKLASILAAPKSLNTRTAPPKSVAMWGIGDV